MTFCYSTHFLVSSASSLVEYVPLEKTEAPSWTSAGVLGITLRTLALGGKTSSIVAIVTPKATDATSGLEFVTADLMSWSTRGTTAGFTDNINTSEADAASVLL